MQAVILDKAGVVKRSSMEAQILSCRIRGLDAVAVREDEETFLPASDQVEIVLMMASAIDSPLTTFLIRLRQQMKDHYLGIYAADAGNLSEILRPAIRPDAVLTGLFTLTKWCQFCQEIIAVENQRKIPQQMFLLKSEGETYRIPLPEILYFEAQGKQMLIRTAGQEIRFYAGFASVMQQLDKDFARCHKGFIVNLTMIRSVNYEAGRISLYGGRVIPLSRSYRNEIRTYLKGRPA